MNQFSSWRTGAVHRWSVPRTAWGTGVHGPVAGSHSRWPALCGRPYVSDAGGASAAEARVR